MKFRLVENINEITSALSDSDKKYIGNNTSEHTVYQKEKDGCYIILDDYNGEYKDEHPFDGLIVTIVASSSSRGKGITDQLIQQAIKDNPGQTLIAEIDSDNIYSINLFKRNGFKLFDEFDNIKFYKFEA